jgi:prophage tail gpP-like protein
MTEKDKKAESPNKVTLRVNGDEFSGWTSVSIAMELQSLARSFAVSASGKEIKTNAKNQKTLVDDLKPGLAVEVSIGSDKVLTGYIVEKITTHDATSTTVTIKGSSKTIDIVDCYVPPKIGKTSYKSQTNKANLLAVCKDYGIDVVDQQNSTDKKDFEIQPAETIGTAILRYLKKNSLLITDDELGRLVIVKSGETKNTKTAESPLQLGVNLLRAERKLNFKKRFSKYVVLGQGTNAKSELPTSSAQLVEISDDPDLRNRVFKVQYPGNAKSSDLKTYADLLKNYSIAHSDIFSCKVQGWRQKGDGSSLWTLNQLVQIIDPSLGFNKQENGQGISWLISKITFDLSSSGMTTSLECKSSNAFKNTEIEKVQTKGTSSTWDPLKINSGKTDEDK